MANPPFNVDEVVVEKVKDDKKRLANSKRQYLANRGRAPTMQYKRLSEIAISVQYGYTAQETSQQGVYKYLRITDIVPYYPNFETVPYCAIDNDEAQKYLLSEGDIVIARTGATTGYNFVVTKKIPPTVFASYLIRFRVDETQAYPKYIKYVLKSKPYYGFVANYVGGSAQPGMGAKVFARFPVPLPPLPTQRAIAEKLGRYDALIENNTRRIAILEAKAEQLYKEWFVRRRYPGHEKAKWIGGLPEGWRVEKIKNVVQRLPFGRTYKEKELSSEGKVIVVDQSTKQWLGFHDDAPSHFANAEKPIILFGDHSCKFQLMTQDFSLGENVIPFIAEKKLNTYYLYYSVHRLICTEEYKRHWGRLSAMKILIPSLDKQNSFANIVTKHAALILNLQRQNALLAKERDLLLPRLMSGKMAAADSLPTGQGVKP